MCRCSAIRVCPWPHTNSTMKCNALVVGSLVLLTSYWVIFLGTELVSTIHLYQQGNSIYHFIPNTTHNFQEDGTKHTLQTPKVMHRMWKNAHILEQDDPELPVYWTESFSNCNNQYQQRNWTTILWTDESTRGFLEEYYPYFIPTYDSYQYDIQRVDAARYFILYHYGGVYMDLDVGCRKRKDLTDLLRIMSETNKTALLPLTQPIGLSNDVLVATKASPFFKQLIETLPSKNKWYATAYLTVLYSTGPLFLSLQYMKLPLSMHNDIFILPIELYTRRGTRYFKHLRGSTWHQNDARLVKWLAKNKYFVSVFLLFAVIACKSIKSVPQKQESKIV